MHLGTLHVIGLVARGSDRSIERLEEARPAGTAVKLCIRLEQRLPANGAAEHARAMLLIECTGAGALGAVTAQHPILLRCELALPLGLRFFNFGGLAGCGRLYGHGATPFDAA